MSVPASLSTAVEDKSRQDESQTTGSLRLGKIGSQYIRSVGPLKLRGARDDLPQDWWFCATAVPLIAATQGPLSNVLSIAALVNVWRVALPNNGELPDGADDFGISLKDPQWELNCNAISLACGFIGNIFLLLHFIGRVRYIVALPLSILFWFLASGILIAITVSMSIYSPPVGPGEIYGQGFWHAVLAAGTYMFGSVMLMANMAGYLLGHYPQDFDLNDDQRTLILQTTMYFVWLAGGAGIYERLEDWTNANALYYCHVSILTIGYGDVVPKTIAGRGFLFLYVPIGIIQLGLVISRIARFASSISSDNIVKKHRDRHRAMTIDRSVTSERELRERLGLRSMPPRRASTGSSPLSRSGSLSGLSRYGKFQQRGRTLVFAEHRPVLQRARTLGGGGEGEEDEDHSQPRRRLSRVPTPSDTTRGFKSSTRRRRRQRLLILKEDEDRFNAMRAIQKETSRFKSYTALMLSIIVFASLWLLGGVIFMLTEARLLELTYFDSLYFCFVSLLTIGYGDISPKSNIGKPVFIVWSLIAVPSLTILIQSMSDTVVTYVDRKTNWLLPEKGFLKAVLDANPQVKRRVAGIIDKRNAQRRVEEGFQLQNPDEDVDVNNDLEPGVGDDKGADLRSNTATTTTTPSSDYTQRQQQQTMPPARITLRMSSCDRARGWQANTPSARGPESVSEQGDKTRPAATKHQQNKPGVFTTQDFAPQLSAAIRRVARDVKLEPPKRYSFDEWLHFTKLIRYSSGGGTSMKTAVAMARSREDAGALGMREERRLRAAEAANDDDGKEEEGFDKGGKDEEEDEEEDPAERGLVYWDWIGEDSPMLSDASEAEWVLDRLCESLARYARWQSRRAAAGSLEGPGPDR